MRHTIVAVIRILGDPRRMQRHHENKNSMLRTLHLASTFHAGEFPFVRNSCQRDGTGGV